VPILDIEIPGISKEVLIGALFQSHALWAAFVIGLVTMGATSEYLGVLTKQPRYDRFAKGTAITAILVFATGSFTPILAILFLITLYPVFWSYVQNIMFWVLLAEAFMFIGEIILIYAWYASWNKLAYRKILHVTLGFTTVILFIGQMTFINVVGSYLLTPALANANNVGATYFNPTFIALNMHRFVGNMSYAGFLVAGFAALAYLRSTRESNREFWDWAGHWGLVWGFGFLLLQPFIGFGYLKAIREHNAAAFDLIMVGDKAWLFELLTLFLGVMSFASVAYCLHKLKFAVKPMPTMRNLTMGALGFLALFSLLTLVPADAELIPQIGLVFAEGEETKLPLGSMYPWKYLGITGMMFVGVFALALYLKATAGGFHWGRASRWSQYALITAAVTVILTMVTMGYTRETARRGEEPGFLISGCITLEQEVKAKDCVLAPEPTPEEP
jgi:cytochrome d ubiquinol oxidase subunit I